jgi:hypothetical protein
MEPTCVNIGEEEIAIRDGDKEVEICYGREDNSPGEVEEKVLNAVKAGLKEGPEAAKKELGLPREAPGEWEGEIGGPEPETNSLEYIWVNHDPESKEHDAYEIRMHTDSGEKWSVSFYEQTEDEEGNVIDSGIALQPRIDGHGINPGTKRTFGGGMRYVEALMENRP